MILLKRIAMIIVGSVAMVYGNSIAKDIYHLYPGGFIILLGYCFFIWGVFYDSQGYAKGV